MCLNEGRVSVAIESHRSINRGSCFNDNWGSRPNINQEPCLFSIKSRVSTTI